MVGFVSTSSPCFVLFLCKCPLAIAFRRPCLDGEPVIQKWCCSAHAGQEISLAYVEVAMLGHTGKRGSQLQLVLISHISTQLI